MTDPATAAPNPPARTMLRKILRVVFYGAGLLILLALGLAGAGWLRSRTPLVALSPGPDAAIDLQRYQSGRLQFPEREWVIADPARLGWSQEKLAALHDFVRGLDSSSLMVVHRGVLIAAWGDVAVRENSQSMRKSLLSSLFGKLVAEGGLDLDATLSDLDIDDHPPLTELEKSATVRQLLGARSGIYHSALYEAGVWKRRKPERGAHPPGERWYYNNWDFNALLTIYERAAGMPLERAFAEQVATPLGMQDFRPSDVVYETRDDLAERFQGNESDHPAYVFMISARDLARFGLLYLAEGRWQERQVLPEGWVRRSTLDAALPTGWGDLAFGWMWWIQPPTDGLDAIQLITRGGRGHRMTIVPALDLVVVHRIPDGGTGLGSQMFRRFVWHPSVDDGALDEVLRRILTAMPPAHEGPAAAGETPPE